MSGIFKAYDIRGIVGETLSEELAEKIGRAFVTVVKCRKVVVGRDMRPHSKPMFDALARGLTAQGADVIDLGVCSTPMSYFANGTLGADASIIITASHNPGEWNGFKLCREKAIPISGATGIMDVEKIVMEESFDPPASTAGTITSHDILPEYIQHVQQYADIRRPLKTVIDYANGMGIVEGKPLENLFEIEPMFDELDGSFPNHEANPLDTDTLVQIQERVRESNCDFGVAFDGDADRAGFIDERGHVVPMDIITALIAKSILEKQPGETIFYDLRSSWAVKEVIEENGGTAKKSRVGHAFIKQQMRDADAFFAGELSGHYYFKDNFYAESAALAIVYVANLISESGRTLSELVAPIQRYYASGEINSEVEDTEAVFERLKKDYAEGSLTELDGVSIEFDEWWFNVRASNTEPLIRLNLEAKSPELMEAKRDELLGVIRA